MDPLYKPQVARSWEPWDNVLDRIWASTQRDEFLDDRLDVSYQLVASVLHADGRNAEEWDLATPT